MDHRAGGRNEGAAPCGRHFHLDDADRAFIAEHRGNSNRLGVAVQLGSVRQLGTFLEDPAAAPASAVRFAADQLSIVGSAEAMAEGPDFINYRGKSAFQAAPRLGIDRNAYARILNALEGIERGT